MEGVVKAVEKTQNPTVCFREVTKPKILDNDTSKQATYLPPDMYSMTMQQSGGLVTAPYIKPDKLKIWTAK